MLSKTIGGHVFGVDVTDAHDAGELASGARGYTAGVCICRDGARIGSGQWDVEGFEACVGPDGRPLDLGDDEAVIWDALAGMVRESLATIPKPEAHAAGGLVLAL